MKQKDAIKILKKGHNALITGAAGSGKTFLAEKFYSYFMEKEFANFLQNAKFCIKQTLGIADTKQEYIKHGILHIIAVKK